MGFLSAREKVGLTQKEVAEKLGVDQSAVSFWETGKTHPRTLLLVKLASFYGYTVDNLLAEQSRKDSV